MGPHCLNIDPPPHPPRPAPAAERLESLDVLRGVALLGIFIMNMPGFAGSFFMPENLMLARMGSLGPLDGAVMGINAALFEGKFNGLFTLLFGMGLALQFSRLGPEDGPRVVRRRLVALFVLGMLHAVLLWGGDVLHIYAVLGWVIWSLRQASARSLALCAGGLLAAQFIHGAVSAQLWSRESYEAEQAFLAGLHALDNGVFGQGPWWEGVALRAREWLLSYTSEHLVLPSSWFWLALMNTAVLGLWVWKLGFLQPQSRAWQWLGSARAGGVLAALVLVGLGLWLASAELLGDHDTGVAPTPTVLLGWALGDLHRVVLTLAYAGLILRWCQGPMGSPWRRHLALAGRMPLTLYLLQSLLGTFIFHGWGLGLWDAAGPAALNALAVALYALVLVPLAGWWLARHEMGPAEALWRRWSYARSPGANSHRR